MTRHYSTALRRLNQGRQLGICGVRNSILKVVSHWRQLHGVHEGIRTHWRAGKATEHCIYVMHCVTLLYMGLSGQLSILYDARTLNVV